MLYSCDVVRVKLEVLRVALVPREHERPRHRGVTQPQGMSDLMGGHRKQIRTYVVTFNFDNKLQNIFLLNDSGFCMIME